MMQKFKTLLTKLYWEDFILRVGDIQYNASIANKLDKLKREFTLN